MKVEADGGGPRDKRCLHPNLFNKIGEVQGSTVSRVYRKCVSKIAIWWLNLAEKLNGVSLIGLLDAWV